MAFISQERTSSVQADRLNLKQTPADIWEYSDVNSDSTPTLSLKSPWKIQLSSEEIEPYIYKPPIGIPNFWFSSIIPDWALDCTDGATGYDFGDYPELNNAIFKQFLADFTAFGSADNTTTFDMPDLQGMFFRIAGTHGSLTTSSGVNIIGGTVGDWQIDSANNVKDLNTISGNSGTSYTVVAPEDGTYSPTMYNTYDSGNKDGTRYRLKGIETKPVSASISMIVRFE